MRLSASTAACVLATAVSAASSDRAECFQTRSRDLARLASCGDWGSINYCLSQKSSPLADAVAANELASITAELESCFVNAGCSWDEAGVEAFWTLRRCEAPPAELRRRFVGLAAAPMTPVVARTPEMTAVADLVERQDATATTSNTSPSPCLTTSMVSTRSCPTQSTGTDSGKSLSCFSTSVPTSVCAAGLICQTSTQGEISCMYKNDKLELSGIIVAIVLATAMTVSVFSVCFFCCKERNTQKRLAKAAEAAEIAREAKNAAMVAAKRPEPSARIPSADQHAGQPLMPEGTHATGPNPFADTHPALR